MSLKKNKIMAFGDLLKGAGDMLNKVKDTIEEATGVDLDGMVDSVTDKLGDAKDFVADKVGDVADSLGDAKDFVADKVGDVTDAVSNPGDLLDKAKDMVGGAKDAVAGKISDLTGGGSDAA